MKSPKMLKVIYNGEFLKSIYPHATKWQIFKYRMAKGIRLAVICLFIAGASVGIYNAGKVSTTATFVQAEDKSSMKYEQKIQLLKDNLIDKLISCESPSYKEEDGLITYDPSSTNPKVEIPSLGQLQFKVKTVVYYYKTLYNKTISSKEAILIALDTQKARELAKDIAFTTKTGFNEWYNCDTKLHLSESANLIKQLSI